MVETGHFQAGGPEAEVTGDVQKALQMLLEDHRKWEKEITAERHQCEQEAADRRE